MNDFVLSQSDKGILDLEHYLLHLLLRQFALVVLPDVAGQVSVLAVLKHQIQVPTRLLRVDQLDYILVLYHRKNIQLKMNSLQLLLGYVLQRYFLYGVLGFVILLLGLKNYRVRALADGFDQQIGTYFGKLFFVMVTFLHRYFYTIQYYLLYR